MKTHYEVLGVTISSRPGDIYKAWQQLARKMHPDRNGGTKEATEAFAELSCAYGVLADIEARKRYDLALSLTTDPCSKCGGTGKTWKQKGFTAKIYAICPACKGAGRAQKAS